MPMAMAIQTIFSSGFEEWKIEKYKWAGVVVCVCVCVVAIGRLDCAVRKLMSCLIKIRHQKNRPNVFLLKATL